MPIKCVIIDDEPLALEVLKQYIGRSPMLELIGSFDDAIEGKGFVESNPVDLLFIDINMPDIKGTDLVRQLSNRPMIIFTTAYGQFALEGFELDAIDYLVKPMDWERFDRAVRKASDYYKSRQASNTDNKNLFVRSEYQLVKIELDNIEYIESVEDYLKFHLTTGRPIMTLMTMKAVLEKLPASEFVRIHRSYIIPIKKIKSIVNRKVKIGNVELPISSSYIDVIKLWSKQ